MSKQSLGQVLTWCCWGLAPLTSVEWFPLPAGVLPAHQLNVCAIYTTEEIKEYWDTFIYLPKVKSCFLWLSAINLLPECMCSNKRLHCLPCSVQSVGLSELVCCSPQIQWALYFDLWFRIHPLKCSRFLQIGFSRFFFFLCVYRLTKILSSSIA